MVVRKCEDCVMPLPVGTVPIGGPIVATAAVRLPATLELMETGAGLLEAGIWYKVIEDPDNPGQYIWDDVAAAAAALTLPDGNDRLDKLIWNDVHRVWEAHSETSLILTVLTPDGPDTNVGRGQFGSAIQDYLTNGLYRSVNDSIIGHEYSYAIGSFGLQELASDDDDVSNSITRVWKAGTANPWFWLITPNYLDYVGYYQGNVGTPLISNYTFSYSNKNNLRGDISVRIAPAGTDNAAMKALFDGEPVTDRTQIAVFENHMRVTGGLGYVSASSGGSVPVHDDVSIDDNENCRVACKVSGNLITPNGTVDVQQNRRTFDLINVGDNIFVDRPGATGDPIQPAIYYRFGFNAGGAIVNYRDTPENFPPQDVLSEEANSIRRNFLRIGGIEYDAVMAQINGERPDERMERFSERIPWAHVRFLYAAPPQFLSIEIPEV